MKVASFVKATALLGAAAFFVASVGVAQAQVDKDNGKCRSTAQKNTGKLQATASKTIAKCWKDVFKSGTYIPCNASTSPAVDNKQKVSKTAGKLVDAVGGVKTKCDNTVHAASLAEYQDCPSPGTQGTGMTTFGQVGLCLRDVATGMADNMHRVAMNPGPKEISQILASANYKQIAKCGNGIQKNFSKLLATVGKEEGAKQVKDLDKNGGPYDYGAHGADPKLKISKAVGKVTAGITKDCSVLSQNEFALLRTCGDLSTVGACLEEIAKNGASGTTAVSFEMPGVCPGSVTVRTRTRQNSVGAASATKLDAGWTGFGMGAELLTFTGDVNLACSDGTCSNCAVSVGCANGNCRCSNDITAVCNTPFVEDVCGGGNTCNALFGSPLPLNASNTPTCLTTQITAPLVGSADIGTGESNTQVFSATKVHTGIGQQQPCPVCTAGSCVGGDRNGMACSNDGVSPVFGATSYDCPPAAASNVSGGGLQIDLLFSDSPPDLDSNVPCTFAGGLSGLDCPCAVCSGDTSIPCNSDGECAAAAAGTCTSIGAGEHTQPSGCDDKIAGCTVDVAGDGLCNGGAVDEANFCEGFLNPDGSGVLTCSNNAECASLSAGNCGAAVAKKCMMNGDDSISITGTFGGQEGAVLGGAFCAPPTASSAINGAAGTPGPVRAVIAWEFDGLCGDGVTPYTLGGTSCP